MKLCLQSVCQFAALSLCYLLLKVDEAESTFVPWKCRCPVTKKAVRGSMIDLIVTLKGPSCDRDEIRVVLWTMKNNEVLCVSPEGPQGIQLIRCWKRATDEGRNVKLCLGRRRKKAQQPRLRKIWGKGGHNPLRPRNHET